MQMCLFRTISRDDEKDTSFDELPKKGLLPRFLNILDNRATRPERAIRNGKMTKIVDRCEVEVKVAPRKDFTSIVCNTGYIGSTLNHDTAKITTGWAKIDHLIMK